LSSWRFSALRFGLYQYGKHSWRFRIDSSDQIEVAGAEHVAHAQIMEVMGGDIGRNIFFVRWRSANSNWSRFRGWNRRA
jgi:hypothetical protein